MIVACYILHYGSDYLSFSLRSIYENVDKIVMVYSPLPSHGTIQTLPNPDTKQHIQDELMRFGDPAYKIHWVEKQFGSEGEHRDFAISQCKALGASHVLVVDADEVWSPLALRAFIDKMHLEPNIRHQLIRMNTLWRSFNHHCLDDMWPERGINLGAENGHGYSQDRVFHFGYARELQHIEYKISIHGHKHEMRPGWLEKFKNWRPGELNIEQHFDVHPTCLNTWTVVPFDANKLPHFMKAHKYWEQPLI